LEVDNQDVFLVLFGFALMNSLLSLSCGQENIPMTHPSSRLLVRREAWLRFFRRLPESVSRPVGATCGT
jgi:hypothetical protein